MSESDQVASHTYELLKPMNAKIDAMAFDMMDVKSRLANVEEGLASNSTRIAMVEVTVAGVSKKMDRLDERIGRIERRLDLRSSDDSDA